MIAAGFTCIPPAFFTAAAIVADMHPPVFALLFTGAG
jgi:hypothetical protein